MKFDKKFTTDEKIAEIEREIAMRKRVYRKRVLNSKMGRLEARSKLECMKQILSDYKEAKGANEGILQSIF